MAETKYDRQLRLWGEDGQRALSQARIVALGATATAIEALKNLILSNIGMVTVVDERVVDSEQIATTFFVEEGDLGRPTAAAVVERLSELNSDCVVRAEMMAPAAWVRLFVAATAALENTLAFSPSPDAQQRGVAFDTRNATPSEPCSTDQDSATTCLSTSSKDLPSCILVSNRYPDFSTISELARSARPLGIPVLCVEARGLVGFVQVHLVDRVVIHARTPTETPMEDLRIFNPFSALQDWFEQHDPMTEVGPLEATARSHLPYPCILYHACKRWRRRAREGERAAQAAPQWPFTADEYKEIRGEVEVMAASLAGLLGESFSEALEMCTERLNRPSLSCPPAPLRGLFNDPRCEDPLRVASYFPPHALHGPVGGCRCEEVLVWFVIQGIRTFYHSDEREVRGFENGVGASHVLPFCGHIPDFMTTTAWYKELCSIYHQKFRVDVQRVTDFAFQAWCGRQTEDLSDATAVALSRWQHGREETYEMLHALATDAVKNIWSIRLVRFSPGYVVEDPAEGSVAILSGSDVAMKGGSTAARTEIRADPRMGSLANEAAWRRRLASQIRHALDGVADSFPDAAQRTWCFGVSLLALQEWTRRKGLGFSSETPAHDGGPSSRPILEGHTHRSDPASPSGLFSFLKSLILLEGVDAWPESTADRHHKDEARSVNRFMPSPTQAKGLSMPLGWDPLEEFLRKACVELERVGSSEIISLAASVGAVAAQEMMKLIQRRRIPAGHPLLYNGYDNLILALRT
ncbi:unnamed protein product [Phytomonas sp. EM1]|nr:unnamed protein product [Phytomonas sp. EM1]|eukprot:CCW63671.1 unnamed protein product [Phytomonas sp. isolate EM1]